MTAPKWWDATFSQEFWTQEEIIKCAEQAGAERFVIGREEGENGYKHFQCRFVFKVEKELGTVNRAFVTADGHGAHWLPTHVRNFSYCEKEGDFYRSWEGALRAFTSLELKPWQHLAWGALLESSDREVVVIYDADGKHGKTWLAKWAVATHRAAYVPPMGEAQDLMAFCLEKPAKRYIFDMPRSESVKQKKGMWSAIEQIKNGYVYDKRYKFRDAWLEPPQVLVFCNEMPDTATLSADRWKFYEIRKNEWDGEDDLVPFDPNAIY